MKQTRILLFALLISTATYGQETTNASAPPDSVYAQPGQLVS
jgi:hypothetical protein